MRPIPLVAAMLAASLLGGCTEEIVTSPDQSSYRQDTNTTAASATTGNQGFSTAPYQGVATSSLPSTSSASFAPAGVQAQVTASQPRGLFKKTLELTVTVSNKDAVARTGYLVATFKDGAGKTDLQYLYLTLAPGIDQIVKLTSSIPATGGTVVFKERFL